MQDTHDLKRVGIVNVGDRVAGILCDDKKEHPVVVYFFSGMTKHRHGGGRTTRVENRFFN
jgi:hypothetical protein